VVTFVFWLVVVLWSFGLAYVFMGARGLQFIAERAFGYTPATVEYAHTNLASVAAAPTMGTREDEYVNGFGDTASNETDALPVAASNAHDVTPSAFSEEEDVRSIIESRANMAGVLLSPEAAKEAVMLRDDRAETLKVFGDILNEAVRTLPREDGWILLSSDRFDELAKAYKIGGNLAGAPEISSEDLNV